MEALLDANERASRELHTVGITMIEARLAIIQTALRTVRCEMEEARGLDMSAEREVLNARNPFVFRDKMESAKVQAQTIDQQINERGNRIREILLAIQSRQPSEAATTPAEPDAG